MSTALRDAARELLRAYEEWIDTPALFPSTAMLEAIDALQEASPGPQKAPVASSAAGGGG